MSLDEEIEIYRFGQDAYPVAALLARFVPLEGFDKRLHLLALHNLIQYVKPVDMDMDRVISDSGLDPDDPACGLLKTHQFMAGTIHIQEGDHDQVYKLLLYVFKQAYQRQLALKKGNSTDWQYTDLSSNETAQSLLMKHKTLAETIYTDTSFRNEFASLAKLWHRVNGPRKTRQDDPAPEGPAKFQFMSYDDLVTTYIKHQIDRRLQAIFMLQRSLRRGLALRYGLVPNEASRLLHDVLERHRIDTYGTGLSNV